MLKALLATHLLLLDDRISLSGDTVDNPGCNRTDFICVEDPMLQGLRLCLVYESTGRYKSDQRLESEKDCRTTSSYRLGASQDRL